eukprot:2689731-Karenia_brevis.AAC.1
MNRRRQTWRCFRIAEKLVMMSMGDLPIELVKESRRWMYGMRQAASAWESHYASRLEGVGFERGVLCGVVFHQEIK